MKNIPFVIQLPEYSQEDEDSLATSLAGQAASALAIIYNTTLDKARSWDGAAFINTPELCSAIMPLATATLNGLMPATGTPSGKYLRDDLTWQTIAGGGDLLAANNLSDVANVGTVRTNLGLNTTANQTDSSDKRFMSDAQEAKLDGVTGTNTGDQDLSGLAVKTNNLSDLTNAATARTNLGVTTQAATLLAAYPIGSIYISVVDTNPSTYFGGTWVAFATGRTIVGIDGGQPEFDAVEKTGGAKDHTLTTPEIPSHTHTQDAHTHNFLPRSGTTGSVSSIVTGTLDTSSTISGANQPHVQAATAINQSTGGGGAHNNLQPYIVTYMFKRTV